MIFNINNFYEQTRNMFPLIAKSDASTSSFILIQATLYENDKICAYLENHDDLDHRFSS